MPPHFDFFSLFPLLGVLSASKPIGYPYLFSSVYNFLHRRLIPLHTYIFNAYTPVSQSFQSRSQLFFESVLLYQTRAIPNPPHKIEG